MKKKSKKFKKFKKSKKFKKKNIKTQAFKKIFEKEKKNY